MSAEPRRPRSNEYATFYAGYVARVADDEDVLQALADQMERTARPLRGLPPEGEAYRYAPGKWSVREVIGHLADVERVFAYRALRFARGDTAALPGFDENAWVPSARFDRRPLAGLLDELAVVRRATLSLLATFDDEEWARRGEANGTPMSVRAVPYVVLGHERHHLDVLDERYLRRRG